MGLRARGGGNAIVKTVYIYTDGACSGNPGPGGWAAILKYNETQKELSGEEPHTTNNRMELTAVIKALEALKDPCHVILTTDSRYVVDGMVKGWARSWKKKRLDKERQNSGTEPRALGKTA